MPPGSRLRQLTTSALGRGARASAAIAQVAAVAGPAALARLARGERDVDALLAGHDPETARRLLASMGRMKGLFMKAGQAASHMDGVFPDGWKEVLAELQHDSPPMEPEVVAGVVAEELGAPPDALFSAWEPEPFAAASIGQVHRARLLDGTEVAVKVQYPGVRDAIAADLRNTAVVGAMKALMLPGVDFRSVEAELEERFLEECDYRIEAANQAHFRTLFADRTGIRVPAVVGDHSSARVLTTVLDPGMPFARFRDTASLEARCRAAQHIAAFVWESIFRHHLFNCDPHPGNFLFSPDGAVTFLDFGCVKRFDPAFVAAWVDYLRSVFERDRARFPATVIRLGFAPNPAKYDFDVHWRNAIYLLRPWLRAGEFTYTAEYCRRSFRELLFDNPNARHANMPRDFVFLNRLQWGFNSIMAALGATGDFRTPFLDVVYPPGAPRPRPWTEAELEGNLA